MRAIGQKQSMCCPKLVGKKLIPCCLLATLVVFPQLASLFLMFRCSLSRLSVNFVFIVLCPLPTLFSDKFKTDVHFVGSETFTHAERNNAMWLQAFIQGAADFDYPEVQCEFSCTMSMLMSVRAFRMSSINVYGNTNGVMCMYAVLLKGS